LSFGFFAWPWSSSRGCLSKSWLGVRSRITVDIGGVWVEREEPPMALTRKDSKETTYL
jgi:hypothetical protein